MLGKGSISINIFLISALWLGLYAEGTTPASSEVISMTDTPCPNELDLEPCYCLKLDNGITPIALHCSDISSLEVMQNVFAKLKEPSTLQDLYLDHGKIKLLPAGLFGKMTFQSVGVANNAIEKIEPGIFKGMAEIITTLALYKNKIKEIDFFGEAKNLRYLSIHEDQCTQLDDYTLANYHNMKYMLIEGCSIQTIGNYAFSNTTGFIRIVNNTVPLRKFGDHVFSQTNGGCNEKIELWNITDDSLSANTFTGMCTANLSISGLTTLKEDIFSPLITEGKVKLIEFREPVICEKSMDWIVNNKTVRKWFKFQCEDENKN